MKVCFCQAADKQRDLFNRETNQCATATAHAQIKVHSPVDTGILKVLSELVRHGDIILGRSDTGILSWGGQTWGYYLGVVRHSDIILGWSDTGILSWGGQTLGYYLGVVRHGDIILGLSLIHI